MKKITIFLFSLLLFAACSDPNDGNIAPATEGSTIAGRLELEPEKYSQWISLLKHADLYNAMNLSNSYTAFIPVNEGVEKYLANAGYESVNDIPFEDAQTIVKYHTIIGKKYEQSQFPDGMIPDTTATGDYLSLEFKEGGLNAIYLNGLSRINALDIQVINGVMHGVDDVLVPITDMVWEAINTEEYSIMAKAIELTGYDEKLNTYRYIVHNEQTNTYTVAKAHFTLFAVSDDVYKSKGIGSVEALCQELNVSGSNYTDEGNELNRYVAYHILDQQLDFTSLYQFPSDVLSKNITPILTGELINISIRDAQPWVNENISFTNINHSVKNGVIHSVNDPMLIKTPKQEYTIWELTDYSALAGLAKDYRKNSLTASSTLALPYGGISSYNWSASNSENNNNSVIYYVASKNDWTRNAFLNTDALQLSLGLYGWIEMETPTLVKGNYKMVIHFYSPVSTAKNGKFKVIMDGNYVGGEIVVNGKSSAEPLLSSEEIGSVEFTKTATHKVRLIQTDTYSIQLDYIEFIPE